MNPLDQLQDIQLPEDPSWWPPAPIFIVLAILLAVMILLVIFWLKGHKKKVEFRNKAIQSIQHLGDSESDRIALQHILKTTAIHYFPSAKSLVTATGESWSKFISSGPFAAKHKEKLKELEKLQLSLYQQDEDSIPLDELKEISVMWLKSDFPPSKKDLISRV